MKFTKALLPVALSALLLAGCTTGKGIITVNGDTITRADYDKVFEQTIKSPQYAMFGGAIKDENGLLNLILKNQIVNELIVQKLLDQELKKEEITASDEEFNAQKDELTEQLGGKEALREKLKQAGVKESELDKDIKRNIQIEKLVEKTTKIDVTDKEAKEFYDKNKKMFTHPELVRASHILISKDDNKIREEIIEKDKKGELTAEQIDAKLSEKTAEIKAKAQQIRQKALTNPEAFASIAKEYSEDPGSQKQGGDLGFFQKGQMVPEFEKVAFSITPNTVSEIVETQFGYHIIIVTDRKKAGTDSYDDVKEEIKARIKQEKKIQTLQKLFDGLKANATIEYTDENFNPDVIQKKMQELSKAQAQKAEEAKKEEKK